MSLKRTYAVLRGSRIDNVWSPGGRWFVTVTLYRSNAGMWEFSGVSVKRIAQNLAWAEISHPLLRAYWRKARSWVHANVRPSVVGSYLMSWLRPVMGSVHTSADVRESTTPYRRGRGFSIWLWGRTHLVIGRWAPSGYDPKAEVLELLGLCPTDDLGHDLHWDERKLAEIRTS